MSQVILELGQGDELPRSHLAARFRNLGALFGAEDVIGINDPLRLDEHAIRLLPKRHKIAFADIERFQHLARDHHLPTLTYASDPLLSRDCFSCHAFRLSDCQKMSRVFLPCSWTPMSARPCAVGDGLPPPGSAFAMRNAG